MKEREAGDVDHPQVVVRPPRLYLGGLVVGGAAEWFWPSPLAAPVPWHYVLGAILATVGLAGVIVAARHFSRAGTNLPTVLPATTLVIDGLHRWSRNPIYVCLTLIYLGVTVAASSYWMLALLAPIVLVMHFGVVRRE